MGEIRDDVIGSFNSFIETEKERARLQRQHVYVSVWIFDTHVYNVFEKVHIETLPQLNKESYRANGWSTAFYDSFISVLNTIEAHHIDLDQEYMVVITDGKDNASREFSKESASAIMKSLPYQFLFLSSDPFALKQASSMGFSTSRFNKSKTGITKAFNEVMKPMSMPKTITITPKDRGVR